jgi:hypothetical protein
MFNGDSYEKIFAHKITNQNVETFKKFFVFPFNKSNKVKPYTSLIIKNC